MLPFSLLMVVSCLSGLVWSMLCGYGLCCVICRVKRVKGSSRYRSGRLNIGVLGFFTC